MVLRSGAGRVLRRVPKDDSIYVLQSTALAKLIQCLGSYESCGHFAAVPVSRELSRLIGGNVRAYSLPTSENSRTTRAHHMVCLGDVVFSFPEQARTPGDVVWWGVG